MIPDDYITIPTALRHIRSRIDEDDVSVLQGNDRETAAIESLKSWLRKAGRWDERLFVMRGGTAQPIPHGDTEELIVGGWDELGRVQSSPKYNGCRLLIKRYDIGSWLGPPPGEDSPFWMPPPEVERAKPKAEQQKAETTPLYPLVPLGYHTIPEVLQMLAAKDAFTSFTDGLSKEERFSVALQDGFMQVYMRADEEIFRVPHEDVRWLSQDWGSWFPEGVIPNGFGRYERRRLLVSKVDIDRWLDDKGEAPFQKSGAPGRPSSMAIVLREAERRRKTGKCEASKQAEAEALETWLNENHPDAPPLKAKTIRNKLPFQYNGRFPKL